MLKYFYLSCWAIFLGHVPKSIAQDHMGAPTITNYPPQEYTEFVNYLPYLNREEKLLVKEQLAAGWGITQAENGKLYFASTGGVLEFDGQNWDVFFPSTDPRLGSATRSIRYDKNTHRIYTGGQNEFGYLEKDKNGRMKYVSLYAQFKDKIQKVIQKDIAEIWSIQVYKHETFFHSRFAVMIYDGKDIRTIPTQESYHRLFVGNQKMYLRQDKIGLCEWNGSEFVPVKFGEMFAPSPHFQISGMIPHYKGGLLLGTRREGLYLYGEFGQTKDEVFSKKDIDADLDNALKQAQIYHIRQLSDGTVAIATLRNGLYILSRELKLLHHLNEDNGLQFNSVLSLFQDNANHLWLSTFQGISKITLNNNYVKYDDAKNVTMRMTRMTEFEGILYGTCNIGVLRLNPKTDKFENVQGIISQAFAMNITHMAGKERLFIGADNLYELQNGIAVPLLKLEGRNIFTYLITNKIEKDIIYCGTNTAKVLKVRYKEGRGEVIDTFQVPEIQNTATNIDENGQFWGADTRLTNGILLTQYSLLDKKIQKQLKPSDFEHLKGVKKPLIKSINFSQNFDRQMLLKINEAYYIYDTLRNTFEYKPYYNRQFSVADSTDFDFLVKKDNTYDVIANTKDRNWVLYITMKNKKVHSIDSFSFKYLNENNYQVRHSTENKEFWLAGQQDLYKLNLNIKQSYKRNFPTYIKNVMPLHNPDSLSAHELFGRQGKVFWTLPYEQNGIRFEYSAVDFSSKDRVKYRYFLEGYDAKWSDWAVENYKEFTNLPEGTYTFQVQALNYFGFEGQISTFKFTILPPWYRTWWAYSLYALLAGLLIYAVVYLNIRRLRKHNEYLERVVKERTREIEFQKEEILAQSEELKQSNEEISAQKEELEAQRDIVEKQNHEMMDSITYGSRIQSAMLPFKDRIDKTLPAYFVLFQPRDIVSGDFYWFHDTHPAEAGAGKAFMAVADCTGHGVPGAFMSMIGNQILYEIVAQKHIYSSDLILNELHIEVRRALRQNETDNRDGMDIGLVVWDKENRQIQFSGAKNNMLYFLHGEMQICKGDKKTIGGEQREEERIFTQQTIALPAQDQQMEIYLYSDGFQDQFGGENRKKFSPQRFRELLAQVHQESMHTQEYTLLHTITNWRNQAQERQTDDILVWGMRV